jgi:hypothetical protein
MDSIIAFLCGWHQRAGATASMRMNGVPIMIGKYICALASKYVPRVMFAFPVTAGLMFWMEDFDFETGYKPTKRCKIHDPVIYKGDYTTLAVTPGDARIKGGWFRAYKGETVVGCIAPGIDKLCIRRSSLKYEIDTVPKITCGLSAMRVLTRGRAVVVDSLAPKRSVRAPVSSVKLSDDMTIHLCNLEDITVCLAEENGGLSCFYRGKWNDIPGIDCEFDRPENYYWARTFVKGYFFGHVDVRSNLLYLSGSHCTCSSMPSGFSSSLKAYRGQVMSEFGQAIMDFVIKQVIRADDHIITIDFVISVAQRYHARTCGSSPGDVESKIFSCGVWQVMVAFCCGRSCMHDYIGNFIMGLTLRG